jgi:hypothetical protein
MSKANANANKKMTLVLSRETVKNLHVTSTIRTGVLNNTGSLYCPVHTVGNFCLPPKTSGCPM